MKKIMLTFSAAMLISMVTIAQTNITLRLAQGQKFLVENTQESSSSTKTKGQLIESNANMVTSYIIEVHDKTGNGYDLTSTITHMKMNLRMAGQEINFDSDSTEDMDGKLGTSLQGYINVPKKIVIDNKGSITTKILPGPSVKLKTPQQLNFETTGYGIQLAFLALPKNAKAGYDWSSKTTTNGVTRISKYTIAEISGQIATVQISGTTVAKTAMQSGVKINTKINGKFTGEAKVDTTTGVVQSINFTEESSGIASALSKDFPTTSKVTSSSTVTVL